MESVFDLVIGANRSEGCCGSHERRCYEKLGGHYLVIRRDQNMVLLIFGSQTNLLGKQRSYK